MTIVPSARLLPVPFNIYCTLIILEKILLNVTSLLSHKQKYQDVVWYVITHDDDFGLSGTFFVQYLLAGFAM